MNEKNKKFNDEIHTPYQLGLSPYMIFSSYEFLFDSGRIDMNFFLNDPI